MYCLEKDKIEEFLPVDMNSPFYSKKHDNPEAAERLDKLQQEISNLFMAIVTGGRSVQRYFL